MASRSYSKQTAVDSRDGVVCPCGTTVPNLMHIEDLTHGQETESLYNYH